MSRLDARLAWTLILRPPVPPVGPVAWPGLLGRLVPDLAPPNRDPLHAVVDGAFGHLVLRRQPMGEGGTLIVSGLGAVVGVTVSVLEPGEVESTAVVDGLRARVLEALGLAEALAGDPVALADALSSADGPWTLEGLVELSAELLEGLAEDLDPDLPAAEVGNVQIVRGGGVGPGHVAWEVTGAFGRRTERPVANRGIVALCEGHLGRVPAPVAYGAAALRFGAGLARAQRQIAALDGLLPTVQAACSWASSRGPWPGPADRPDYAGLAARLELLKVGLQESHEALREGQGPLLEAARRALVGAEPQDGGPFVEASARGEAALSRIAGRVASVSRWAGALALAGAAVGG